MPTDHQDPPTDDESQPLTENSLIFSASNDSSPRHTRSSSSVSTTSLVLEHLQEHVPSYKKDMPYTDEDPAENGDFQEMDIEEGPLLQHGKPVDARYRRWLWILGALCSAGWGVALVLFVINGTYKHRSSLDHDPDATHSAGSGKRITIDEIQQGRWQPQRQQISWIADPNGTDGLMLEKSLSSTKDFLKVEDVRTWEDKTSANEPLILMKKPDFQASTEHVFSGDVWPSPDLKTVLVASERKRNWRHSFTAKYWLFDVEGQTGQPLDPTKPNERIQLGTWSPNSDAVVFTRENNMFLRKVSSSEEKASVVQITTDGGEEMFNGVPDWVYEEEVFSGNSATWWSPDAKYIAFLATNESGVPEYPVQYFVSRPSGVKPPEDEESYPEVRQIKYPKAGAHNPVVRLRFFDVAQESTFSVAIPEDFADDNRLITEVIWAGETGKVLVRQTNRESDILKMVLIDVAARTGSIVRTQDVNKLDGGWFEISETTTIVPKDTSNGRPDDGYLDTVIYEGYDHLAYFSPLDSAEPKVMLTSGEWEVDSAPSAVDLKSNSVYFSGTKESSLQRQTYRVSLDGHDLESVTDTKHEGYYDVSFSTGAGYALVSYHGPKIPWQKVINTPTSNETFSHVVEENKALASLASAHELPLEVYGTVTIDGFELNVVERRPPHFDPRHRYPVLFQLYGGPGSQTVDKKFTVDFQSYVASTLGYIVVTVDGRGTGFIGRKGRCAVRGDIGYWEAHDQIETAKIWAAKHYVDASRIAIWGWSYGGYLALKTLEQDAGRTFHYGMAVAPVTDWRFYDSIYTERWMHTPQHNAENYTRSAVTNVTALAANTRFLIMHGVADDNVHLQNTLTLLDKLDLEGIENYDVHVFPDSDHSIYFHNANRMVYDKLRWWLVNAFNGEWARLKDVKPLRKEQQVGTGR